MEDALDDEDEGATVGVPRAYAISARRLGVPPAGLAHYRATALV